MPDDDERDTDVADIPTAPRVPRPRLKRTFDPGTIVDRYVIVEAIGRGGMGAVMLAYDTVLSRRVALKVLHTELVSEDARSRMQREAQAMAQLSHPNVVAIYDVGAFEGNLYLAMEYVEGETLRTWLKTPRSWRDIVDVMIQAAHGLAVAHAGGIIHRDFKPSNVIVANDGRVCVLDFGIASASTGSGEHPSATRSGPFSASRSGPHSTRPPTSSRSSTRSGGHAAARGSTPPPAPSSRKSLDPRELIASLAAAAATATASSKNPSSPPTPMTGGGTPSAPSGPSSASLFDEKLTETGAIVGTPGYFAPETVLEHKADARSDIWGFCITLWRALYGAPPFPTDLAAYLSVLMDGAPRTRPKKTNVPAWLHKIVDRGLAISPDARFSSMEELISELSRERTMKHRRLAAGVLAVAAVVLVALTLSARSMRQDRAIADQCAQGEVLMSTSWSPATRERVRTAMMSAKGDGAKDSASRTIKNLDEYAAAWAGAYREASEATLKNKTETTKTLDARLACLDIGRAEFDALASELAKADAALATQAVAVTYQLTAPKLCLDPSVLRMGASGPKSSEAHAREIGWRHELSRAEALDLLGKFDAATEAANRVLAEARAVNDRDTQAIALKRLGDVADERDQYSESLDFYTKALAGAEASGNERLAIQVAARLAVCIGDRLNRPRDAESWIQLARGKLDHYGTNEALEWEVLKAELIVIGDNDQLEESLATYPRLIALSERVFGASHPRTAQVLANYGYDLADSGHYDLSIAQYVRALSILEKAWGERHPNLALFYTNYAHFLARGGHTEEGFKNYEHALALNSQLGENRMTSEILGKIATLSVRRRDWAKADQMTKRGIQIAENIGKDAEPDLARLLVANGFTILGRRGDPKEVSELCTRALPLLEPLDGAGNFRADVLRCLGEASLAMGDPDAAITLLERGEKLPRHEWPGDLALTRYALARALTAAHKDPARAVALATLARDDLRKVNQLDADLAEIDQWLSARH